MQHHYSVQNPTGITVFGSALTFVDPDVATIAFSVGNTSGKAAAAFAETKNIARQINSYLASKSVTSVKTSAITLMTVMSYREGQSVTTGYKAEIRYSVAVQNIDLLEDVLTGLVDVGVESIAGVDFDSTQLKAHYAATHTEAIMDAREKARIYCEAVGRQVGDVVHIEDVDPDSLEENTGAHLLHDHTALQDNAVNPGSLKLQAAVWVTFTFAETS